MKNRSTLRILLETIIELLRDLRMGFVKELDKLAIIIQILIPVAIVNFKEDIIVMVLISVCMLVVSKYIREVYYKLNKVTERGYPIPDKRYTQMDENGFISIPEDETIESMLYLYEVEEYLKGKGWL